MLFAMRLPSVRVSPFDATPPLSFTHTHTHARTHSHTRTHARTHARTHTHTHTHTHCQSQIQSRDLLKCIGIGLHRLAYIINIVWIKKTIPDDWRRGIILPFWKNKGNKEVCSNHRGITLLSIPGKLFAMILLERICHNHRRSEQAGFTAGRSTTEQIFAIRQIIENRRNLISLPTLPLST